MDWIIAGLGNIGPEYALTRHNAGFLAADAISDKYGIKLDRAKFSALTGQGIIEGRKVLLMKPTTYMNNSGRSIGEAADFYKLPPEQILIVYDDAALPFGSLRLRPAGSDGGHNGMKSLIYHLHSDNFPRLRIGIGPPPDIIIDWVLSRFSDEERAEIPKIAVRCAETVAVLLKDGIQTAMNKYNTRG